MHLSNEGRNRKTMCTRPILNALVQGASISDDDISNNNQLEEIRDSAIRAIERGEMVVVVDDGRKISSTTC